MRATAYLRNLPESLRERVSLSAVADPSIENRDFFVSRFGNEQTVSYDSAHDLLNRETADALIIASPNHAHVEHLIPALKWNVPILIEKPICISLEDCHAIWHAYQYSQRPTIFVGFVLRYTPFYRKVQELVQSGILGQILQVDGDEIVGTALTSVFFREGWRLQNSRSGGVLLEKCCHDFDVLSLLAGAPAKSVFSFAARTHFISRPREEQHARFDAEVTRRLALDYGDAHIKRFFESTSDESVYNERSEVPDHQSALVEYENGVLTAFTVTFGQPRQTRLLRIMGSNGLLTGDIQGSWIEVDIGRHREDGWERQRFEIAHDKSGHNGGDSHINDAFWAAVAGNKTDVRAGLREGLEATITSICAEESNRTGSQVSIRNARAMVFAESAPVSIDAMATQRVAQL